jgi:hypothetical protein
MPDSTLSSLLAEWRTPGLDLGDGFRFHDAPPATVRTALRVVGPQVAQSRPNGQPPAAWLVDIAERLEGLLAGLVGTDPPPERLRVDAVCVPAHRAAELARAVAHDWPEPVLHAPALEHALAEAWERWDATEAVWSGSGSDLLEKPPPAPVVGLWWD